MTTDMPSPDPLDALLAGSPPPPPRAGRPPAPARPVKSRPDPRPMRLAFAVTGIAAASAMATAIVAPGPTGGTNGTTQVATVVTAAQQPQPSPSHITKYVRLAPGQTAPPQAPVQQLPPPAPRVVVVTTRQSGAP